MTKLTKLGVLSVAKALAGIMAFVGLIAGLIYAIGGAIYDILTGAVGYGTALAFLAMLGMPVLFAAAGFVAGAVIAWAFNRTAARLGGIEITLE